MGWATKMGFKGSAFIALIDILLVKQITERKAQLARFAYFTIPLTTMAAGWMGGIEVGKIVLGRDSQEAWLAGAIVPGGIMGIWTRNIYGGMRTSILLGGSTTMLPCSGQPRQSTEWKSTRTWDSTPRTLDRPGRSGRIRRSNSNKQRSPSRKI